MYANVTDKFMLSNIIHQLAISSLKVKVVISCNFYYNNRMTNETKKRRADVADQGEQA